ncbi:PHD finger protein ALFIN-LIKE 8 [Apostasia shenzhenica]|uniref:PHD finger protein ALFIN-LIKE n=1 Tax=Apostasia shenzhenica TaxID=1088818 RepID=A0A2I0BB57_9ASPA|nr:PHD finger protein ALFIN-LIKE 8 [Apostasia shenzhenica]
MEGGGAAYNPRTPEEVFRDFRGRRAGMVKALTTDVEKFYQLCDPEKENLCLYGLPNETWEVTLPAEEVPPELPEPALGINFARDGMDEKDWLSLVAVHSDAWLLAVAFYFGARFGFDKEARKRLFTMINSLPTIYEVVTGAAKRQSKEKTPNSSSKSNKLSSKSELYAFVSCPTLFSTTDLLIPTISHNLIQRLQRHNPRKTTTKAVRRRKMTMSTGTHCVELAETTMPTMSSGFAAMFVSDGSTESALRSHLQGPSTSSSINAQHAATKGPGPEHNRRASLLEKHSWRTILDANLFR